MIEYHMTNQYSSPYICSGVPDTESKIQRDVSDDRVSHDKSTFPTISLFSYFIHHKQDTAGCVR